MKIAFQSNQIGLLGTEVSLYDYAHYVEEFFGYESHIVVPEHFHNPHIDSVVKKFKDRFEDRVYFYKSNYNGKITRFSEDTERYLVDNNIDVFYTIKAGNKNEVISKKVKTCVHAVFQMFEPHGDVYAYISKWLTDKMTGGKYPYVPHMINLPDVNGDLKEELNIPKDAVVFGRYGGIDSFNLPFVVKAINRIVDERKDVYFLFANTKRNNLGCPPLKNHDRIILTPPITNLDDKVKFINSCDVMLHARINGESFGIAIGEFSIKNKPILTWTGSNSKKYYSHLHDKCHIDILGDKGIFYEDHNIYNILKNFEPTTNKNWDAYSEFYSPIPVMNKFHDVFIEEKYKI